MSPTVNASLSFVELTVRDLAAAVGWYRENLGLRLAMRDEDSFALLEVGPTRLALKQGTPSPGGVLLAFEVADLEAWVRGFVGRGGCLVGEMKASREGYRRVLVDDADGYAVSVFQWAERREGVGGSPPTPSPK